MTKRYNDQWRGKHRYPGLVKIATSVNPLIFLLSNLDILSRLSREVKREKYDSLEDIITFVHSITVLKFHSILIF